MPNRVDVVYSARTRRREVGAGTRLPAGARNALHLVAQSDASMNMYEPSVSLGVQGFDELFQLLLDLPHAFYKEGYEHQLRG